MFLKLNNITKKFGRITAVSDLSIELEKGKLLCLLGPSGCGKTTALKIIGGFLSPDSGQVFIDNEDITKLPPEKRPLSTVFQSYALFPNMNVLENVIYGLKFHGYKKAEAIKKGEVYLEMVGLKDYRRKRIADLSGGQQQRVALARSLIINPKVLLLDEPLSNLDAKLRIKMREEIKEIQSKFNITMVFVTHDQEEALSISDKICIMNAGKLEQTGEPREIYNHPKTSFVLDFIGHSNILKVEGGKTFYIRPERIELCKGKGTTNGIIQSKSFMGAYIIYSVRIGDSCLTAQLSNKSEAELNIGDEVSVSYSIEDAGF